MLYVLRRTKHLELLKNACARATRSRQWFNSQWEMCNPSSPGNLKKLLPHLFNRLREILCVAPIRIHCVHSPRRSAAPKRWRMEMSTQHTIDERAQHLRTVHCAFEERERERDAKNHHAHTTCQQQRKKTLMCAVFIRALGAHVATNKTVHTLADETIEMVVVVVADVVADVVLVVVGVDAVGAKFVGRKGLYREASAIRIFMWITMIIMIHWDWQPNSELCWLLLICEIE